MNKKVILSVICFILSLVITIQFRTTKTANSQIKSIELQMNDIAEQLKEERKITDNLNSEINSNLKKKEEYLKEFALIKENDEIIDNWEYVSKKAGLTDITGSGVVITLNDAPSKNDTYKVIDGQLKNMQDMRNFIIHDIDIVHILNELKIYGCQAISINDERIISTSEQICVGPTVRVNKKKYAPPYVIKAIGDSNLLFNAINNSDYINFLRKNKLEISVKKEQELTIFKYKYDTKNLVTGLEVVKDE